jgi:P27 family predicted phage terminase small subunit
MPGPRPTPTRLKVLRGNPGRRPLNPAEPSPPPADLPAPDHLGDEAKAEWQRISAELMPLGLKTAVDLAALAAYCVAYGRWVEAEREVKKLGTVLVSADGGLYQNPHLAVANRALDQLHRWAVEFGLSPAARTRVSASAAQAEDDFETFLRGQREAPAV